MSDEGTRSLPPEWRGAADHADALLRARSRRLAEPVLVAPAPGYPVPPRRKARLVDPRPSAHDLANRDWFAAGCLLGALGGIVATGLVVTLLLILAR